MISVKRTPISFQPVVIVLTDIEDVIALKVTIGMTSPAGRMERGATGGAASNVSRLFDDLTNIVNEESNESET